LAKELHFVEDYIELQSARYNNRIEMTVDAIPEGIRNVPVPKFVIQPLVENSIVHGLKNQSQGGFIRVSSIEKPDFVQIIVEDNGCGFDVDQFWKVQNRHDYGKHISIGLQNVVERLKYIGGKIQIDSEIGAGTRITLLLPKRIRKMSQTVECTEL
jgi:two-component system sensor histidine kinase YesM